MGIIESLVPEAGQADMAGLRTVGADELARYVIDAAHPWWRRRSCVRALAGRVPAEYASELMDRVRDRADVGEVRIALLEILGDREELLPWLRHEDRATEKSHRVPEAVLKARAAVGDRTAVRDVATLANDPWSHRRVAGEAGMDLLVARYGLEAILAELGDARPEDRAFRVRMQHRAGEDVTGALGDPDVGVAHLAYGLVDDADALRRFLVRTPTRDAKIWAACALDRLTGDPAEARAVDRSLGRPRVEVDGLDEEIRAAIVNQYVRRSQPHTDPRWRLEAICAEPWSAPDVDGQLRRATAALASVKLAPKPPVHCADEYNQGDGTYHVIEHGAGRIYVSSLGRFVSDEDADPVVRGALEAAGFRWIDARLGQIIVAGLPVYHFGRREPLSVHTLLFFWQD